MKRSMFLLITLCLVTGLLTACQQPGPTQTTLAETSEAKTSQETQSETSAKQENIYYASDGSYSVVVPDGWETDTSGFSNPTMVSFIPPVRLEGNLPLAVLSADHYDDLEDAEFSIWFQELLNEQLLDVDVENEFIDQVDGRAVYRYDFTGRSSPQSVLQRFVYYYCVKDNSIYLLAFSADTDLWEDYYPVFEEMYESFAILD